jgi:SAM-dependent methyltransferase
MTKLDECLDKITTAATGNTLLKVTLGNRREKTAYLKNVFIKPVTLKTGKMLTFIYRHNDKDVTKNFTLAESTPIIKKLLQDQFLNAEIFTSTQTFYYTQDANGKEKLITKLLQTTIEPTIASHDKQKNHIVQANAFYLKELGVTTADGKVKSDMQHKFRQINKYVEIIDGILKNNEIAEGFSVVDMGSGKGYLTFALYDFLNRKNKAVQVSGIEFREDLVTKCNTIAQQAKYNGLSFTKGSINEIALPAVDMLIALHACDTATDDAIAKGIKAKAQYIICAPCCHKQIRKQMAPTNALQYITKHGILLERQAEMVTDTIRALLLEAHGYKTKVFDFIEAEHTPKNVLIVGTKTDFNDTVYKENIEKVKNLKELFGIKEHYLETLL